jgi:hypothetical protein
MIVLASQRCALVADGEKVGVLDTAGKISLVWQR